jgi:hypothetical protein
MHCAREPDHQRATPLHARFFRLTSASGQGSPIVYARGKLMEGGSGTDENTRSGAPAKSDAPSGRATPAESDALSLRLSRHKTKRVESCNSPGWIRTTNPLINSQMLCR